MKNVIDKNHSLYIVYIIYIQLLKNAGMIIAGCKELSPPAVATEEAPNDEEDPKSPLRKVPRFA